jgi:hypothetical protein
MAESDLSTRLQQAVYNNAVWCDMVCRANGIPGEFEPDMWLNRNRVPPYYPNAVTLSGKSGVSAQLITIQKLVAKETLTDIAVKDSFNVLDLTLLGFRSLFEAMWLWRAPSLPEPAALPAGVHWTAVQQPDELEQWERAWTALPANQQLTPEKRIFLPSLLADRDVVFIAAYREQQIVGGAIGNRTGTVVGLSNQFAPSDEADSFGAGCISMIMNTYPGLAIVGYEHGAELALAKALGFEEIGPLRVWAHTSSPT